MLFTGDNNILSFLIKVIPFQDKQVVKTKEAVLIFINDYIKLLGKKIQDYAKEIKVRVGSIIKLTNSQETCFSIFRREQSNVVKIATFKPITKILELQLQIMDAERF